MEDYRAILADMRGALRSEHGARTIYPLLARLARNPELRGVLSSMRAEQEQQIRRLAEAMAELGPAPRRTSLRRSAMAWALFLSTPLIGMRFALRLCHDAEARVSRWYHGYSAWFADRGDLERARFFRELSLTKYTHAQVLEAFLMNASGRWSR